MIFECLLIFMPKYKNKWHTFCGTMQDRKSTKINDSRQVLEYAMLCVQSTFFAYITFLG